MVLHASVVSFLKTGRIGPIHIGMKMAEVERLAGPPQWDCGYCWFYGSVDIGFTGKRRCRSRVQYLQVDDLSRTLRRFVGARGLQFHDNLSSFSTIATENHAVSFDAFMRFARRNNIGLVKVSHTPFEEEYGEFGMMTEGGVVAHFQIDEEGGGAWLGPLLTEDVDRFYTAKRRPVGFARDYIRLRRRERHRDG